jgi:pinin
MAVASMEVELRNLQQQRRQIELRLKNISLREAAMSRAQNRGGERGGEDRPHDIKRSRDGDFHRDRHDDEVPPKRRAAQQEQADEPEEGEKPRLGSAVVSTRGPAIGGEKPQPSVESNDPATQKRNKRLFGVMLGTLQRFKKDLTAADDKLNKRRKVESEVEVQAKQQSESLIDSQRRQLKESKDKELTSLDDVRKKLSATIKAIQEEKVSARKRLFNNFFQTEAKPRLYWKPAKEGGNEPVRELKKQREEAEKKAAEEQKLQEEKDRAEGKEPAAEEKLEDLEDEKSEDVHADEGKKGEAATKDEKSA